jgi:ADP-heptose:LPS heptosyltransferase
MAKGMGKPTVAFFGPTSAAEVSAGNNGVNIRALEEYYCNYSSTSIFSSLSTSRIIEGFNRAIELSNEE